MMRLLRFRHAQPAPGTAAMIRGLFNLLSLVSALLLAAALVLWVRGYWVTDHFWLIFRDNGGDMIRSQAGRFTVRHVAPNVRTFPVPRRVTHWSCRTGSQLPPARSPMHWEGWLLSFEGTPRATPQEIQAARTTLKSLEGPSATVPEERPPGLPEAVPGQSDEQALAALDAWREQMLAYQQRRMSAPLWNQMRETWSRQAKNLLSGTYYHEWTFPAWLAVVALSVVPGLWLAMLRRRRLMRLRGLCPNCGYDLRASGERCPECGTSVPSVRSASKGA